MRMSAIVQRMLATVLIFAGSACVHGSTPIAPAMARYQVVDLGSLPGDNWTEVEGMNERGEVLCTAGVRTGYDPQIADTRAFLWKQGQRRDIGVLPGNQGVFLSSKGQVLFLVTVCTLKTIGVRICLWQNGKLEAIPAPSPPDRGRVLSLPSPCVATAVAQEGAASPLVIAGDCRGHRFLWRKGTLVKLRVPGAWGTQVRAVNVLGQCVGAVSLPTGHSHALLWQNGKSTDLGTLTLKHESAANSINRQGEIAGWSTTGPGTVMHAVLWKGKSIRDLNSEIPALPHVILSEARGINSRGQIICNGFPAGGNSNDQHAYLLVPR